MVGADSLTWDYNKGCTADYLALLRNLCHLKKDVQKTLQRKNGKMSVFVCCTDTTHDPITPGGCHPIVRDSYAAYTTVSAHTAFSLARRHPHKSPLSAPRWHTSRWYAPR